MSSDPLWTEYHQYDRRVDVVSIFEVWFTRSQGLPSTVAHFERFPRLIHPDGNPAAPDFTVLFHDRSAIAGELANLARPEGSLDELASQIGRYETLTHVPGGPRGTAGQPLAEVSAIDVVVVTPLDVMNPACDRLAAAIDDENHPYAPTRPPMVLGHTLDRDTQTYTFVRPTRARNELLPDYGRDPSLSRWLAEGSDTLRCSPRHFAPIKTRTRVMNDSPPPLYTATVLWSTLIPAYLAENNLASPADLSFNTEQLVARMERDCGLGRTKDVVAALEFLKVARLAVEHGHGWDIYFRDLGAIEGDIASALLHEYRSSANKARPIRTATAPREQAEPEDTQESLLTDA